jgi:hypothetical protein
MSTATSTVTATASSTSTEATATVTATATATPTGTAAASATSTVTGTITATPAASVTATPTLPPSLTGPTAAYFAEGYTGTAAVNGRATFTETLNILNPSTRTATVTITYYLQGSTTPLAFTRTISPTTILRESVNTDVGPDKFVAAVVTAPQRVFVTRTITRVAPDGSRLDGSTTLPVSAPGRFWGFPEGYTGVTFQQYLTILNPSSSQANVTITLAPQASSAAGAKTLNLTVPALSRATANIRSLNLDNPAKSIGMVINSDQPIVPERVLYFGDGAGSGKFGSTVSRGMGNATNQFYLAYGSSGGSATSSSGVVTQVGNQDFITLLNTSSGAVQVTATFFDQSGRVIRQSQPVTVAPGTRNTIIANNVLGSAPVTLYSAVLRGNGPFMAESAQYFNGSPNVGKHPGVNYPLQPQGNSDVFLSALATQLQDNTTVNSTVFLYNPGSAPLQVTGTYFGANGKTSQSTYSVSAGGITTVDAGQDSSASIPPGPLGAEFTVSGGNPGTIIANAVARTSDDLSATEDIGVPPS